MDWFEGFLGFLGFFLGRFKHDMAALVAWAFALSWFPVRFMRVALVSASTLLSEGFEPWSAILHRMRFRLSWAPASPFITPNLQDQDHLAFLEPFFGLSSCSFIIITVLARDTPSHSHSGLSTYRRANESTFLPLSPRYNGVQGSPFGIERSLLFVD
jgi:hypothetical protein